MWHHYFSFFIFLSTSNSSNYYFLETQYKHSLSQTCTYARMHTLSPWEHLKGQDEEFLRLTKSPHVSHYRRECGLPLKEYSVLWNTKASNLGFDPWWAGCITALLTIQRLVGFQITLFYCRILIFSIYWQLDDDSCVAVGTMLNKCSNRCLKSNKLVEKLI